MEKKAVKTCVKHRDNGHQNGITMTSQTLYVQYVQYRTGTVVKGAGNSKNGLKGKKKFLSTK